MKNLAFILISSLVLLSSCRKESDFNRYIVGSYTINKSQSNSAVLFKNVDYSISEIEFLNTGTVNLTDDGIEYSGYFTYQEDFRSSYNPNGPDYLVPVKIIQIFVQNQSGEQRYYSWEVHQMNRRKLWVEDVINDVSLTLREQ